jgi:hypothetical protein
VLSHTSELRVLPLTTAEEVGFSATTAAEEGSTESLWAGLPPELLTKVLEAAWRSATQAEGLGFSQASATVRLVCAQWQAVHDAMVKRLVVWFPTDEAVGTGATVPGGGVAGGQGHKLTAGGVDGQRAASSEQPCLADVPRPQRLPQRHRRGHASSHKVVTEC